MVDALLLLLVGGGGCRSTCGRCGGWCGCCGQGGGVGCRLTRDVSEVVEGGGVDVVLVVV